MEEKIFLARVTEQAERFEDMVEFLIEAIKLKSNEEFTIDERNLLSVGFKNLIGSQRTAIRTIGAVEQNPKYTKYAETLASYKMKIQTELYDQCIKIVRVVEDKCLNLPNDSESKTFFYKMIGDYYRYVAESALSSDHLEEVKQGALQGYQKASQHSETLNACNPIRLGLALNQSVFYYEVMSDQAKALTLGETALTDALEKIDDVDEDTFRDAKSIIELLKENISLWKEEDGVEDL